MITNSIRYTLILDPDNVSHTLVQGLVSNPISILILCINLLKSKYTIVISPKGLLACYQQYTGSKTTVQTRFSQSQCQYYTNYGHIVSVISHIPYNDGSIVLIMHFEGLLA